MTRSRAGAALSSVAKASDKFRLSRRRLLARGVGLGGLLLLPRRAWAAEHEHGTSSSLGLVPDKIVPAMDQPLIEPQVRRSANGVLQTSLNCHYAYQDVGGVRLYVRTYEETVPGPTMRMKPGEVLRIRLANNFPPNRDQMPMDISNPHQFNNTNFHFHGVHSSPSGISDNVMRSMEPGHTYDIEIKVPKDHPRGTYWYHPHHHGSADVQMASGMAGVIVIEGDFADVPEIANARERVMVLSQVVFDASGMVESFDTLFPETATRFLTVNGQRRPVIEMRPGEVQRWRLLNAGYQDDMLLELQNHELHAVAYDGIQLGSVEHFKQMIIVPGQRADVLVQGGAPGTYELRATDYDQGHASPTGPLARVVVAGDPMPHEAAGLVAQAALRIHQGFGAHGPTQDRPVGNFAGGRRRGSLAGVWLLCGWEEVRSEAHRPARQARLGRGVDDREHAHPRRPHLPHPRQSVRGHPGQRQATRHDTVARHGRRGAQGRHPHVPLALHRLHRGLHDALPHDEP
jgi:FtsP/CotA-like multicopper oxidase with cupredoxin domain